MSVFPLFSPIGNGDDDDEVIVLNNNIDQTNRHREIIDLTDDADDAMSEDTTIAADNIETGDIDEPPTDTSTMTVSDEAEGVTIYATPDEEAEYIRDYLARNPTYDPSEDELFNEPMENTDRIRDYAEYKSDDTEPEAVPQTIDPEVVTTLAGKFDRVFFEDTMGALPGLKQLNKDRTKRKIAELKLAEHDEEQRLDALEIRIVGRERKRNKEAKLMEVSNEQNREYFRDYWNYMDEGRTYRTRRRFNTAQVASEAAEQSHADPYLNYNLDAEHRVVMGMKLKYMATKNDQAEAA
jgi:hypothetical protein